MPQDFDQKNTIPERDEIVAGDKSLANLDKIIATPAPTQKESNVEKILRQRREAEGKNSEGNYR